jgi:hypothetical protein
MSVLNRACEEPEREFSVLSYRHRTSSDDPGPRARGDPNPSRTRTRTFSRFLYYPSAKPMGYYTRALNVRCPVASVGRQSRWSRNANEMWSSNGAPAERKKCDLPTMARRRSRWRAEHSIPIERQSRRRMNLLKLFRFIREFVSHVR